MGTSEPGKRPKPAAAAGVGETRHIDAAIPPGSADPPRRGSGAEDTVPADSSPPADGWPVAIDPVDAARHSGRIDRYVFGAELGRGGMGRVVEATDTRLGRKVAVKEALPRGLDLRRRFEREVRITARLEHPSIVPLYDAGLTAAGNPFYVMRKVSGRPLDKLIADARDLGERLMLVPNLLAAIDAIAHAHRRDVVHRDMKPANVLVGEHGETVVIDWGLAKALGEDDDAPIDVALAPSSSVETQIGSVFGTPGFMAPEQARGEALDPRSDVYALGATLYQLLSGRPPHSGASATDVIDRALVEPPPKLNSIVTGVPPELVAIVDKALAFAPADRYPDAGALAEDVRRFLAGQLVAAHRYTPRQRLGRFLRRHRAAVAVGSLAMIALVVGGAFSVHGIVTERDRAMRAETRAVNGQRAAEEARDREADRADELLVTQARALVDINPTAAIAALKLVAPSSSRWRNARMVALAAASRGAAWGYPGHGRMTASLELAPDGRRLLSAGEANGLRIIDLDRHEELLHVDFPERIDVCWIEGGDAVLVGPQSGGLLTIDANSGARTPIDWVAGVHQYDMAATDAGDRVFITDSRRQLGVLDVATRVVTPIPVDIPVENIATAPDGSWLVTGGNKGLRVLRPDGKVLLRMDGQLAVVRVGPGGRRAAAILEGRTIVLDIDGDHVTPTWIDPPTIALNDRVLGLAFRGDALLINRVNHHLEQLRKNGTLAELGRPENILAMGAEARGEVVAYSDTGGQLVLDTPLGLRTIRAPSEVQLKRVAARPNSRYIAVGTDDLILVWDLDRVMPTMMSVGETQDVTFRDDDTLLITPRTAPWRLIDVRSGAATVVDPKVDFTDIRALVVGDDGRILVLAMPWGVLLVRPGETRPERVADGEVSSIALLGGDRFAYGTTEGKLVIGRTRADRRILMNGTSAVRDVVQAGDGLVALTVDGDLVRFDGGGREAARIHLPPGVLGGITVDDAGRIVLGLDKKLLVWNGARLDELARFDSEVAMTSRSPAGVVATTFAGDVHLIGPDGKARRVLARTRNGSFVTPSSGYLVSTLADGQIVVVDLQTSERAVLPALGMVLMPSVSPGGRHVAYRLDNTIALWTFDAPTDPDAWPAWLGGLTNALPSTTPDVVWPWQTP